MLTVVIFWQIIFFMILNAAFSKILNEFGQLLHYKKTKFRDNLCDLIGDP